MTKIECPICHKMVEAEVIEGVVKMYGEDDNYHKCESRGKFDVRLDEEKHTWKYDLEGID